MNTPPRPAPRRTWIRRQVRHRAVPSLPFRFFFDDDGDPQVESTWIPPFPTTYLGQDADGCHEWLLDPQPGALAEPWRRDA